MQLLNSCPPGLWALLGLFPEPVGALGLRVGGERDDEAHWFPLRHNLVLISHLSVSISHKHLCFRLFVVVVAKRLFASCNYKYIHPCWTFFRALFVYHTRTTVKFVGCWKHLGVNSRFSFFINSPSWSRFTSQSNIAQITSASAEIISTPPPLNKRCCYSSLCGSQWLPVELPSENNSTRRFPPGVQWHDGKQPNCCVHRLSLCSLHAWVQKQFINAFFLESLWSEKHVLKHTKYSM